MKYRFLFLLTALPLISNAQLFQSNQRVFDTIPFIPEHQAERLAIFAKESVVTGKIVFLGNSITEGGNWAKLTGDPSVVNRGIGGDITYTMLRRLDDVIKRKPSKLFILIGINDIGKDIPDEVIGNNYLKIIQKVKAQSPATRIFVQSILPVNPTVNNFPQHYHKNEHIVHTNQLLRQVAEYTKCTFVDTYSLFVDEQKNLKKIFTFDGLHLNPAGYDLWVNHLKQNGYL